MLLGLVSTAGAESTASTLPIKVELDFSKYQFTAPEEITVTIRVTNVTDEKFTSPVSVLDPNGSIIEELFVTVTAATFTKTPAPVVSGTYQLSADTISKAANSKIKVDGMVQEKVSGNWTSVAAADVKVTYTVQTWNTSTGTWNVAKTYLVDVGTVSAGTAIGATLNLPVPTNSPVLVSAVVETSVGTFMLGEQVVTV